MGTTFFLSALAVMLLEYIPTAEGNIQCYKCIIANPLTSYGEHSGRLCKDFDYSDDFIVNCPNSTFCRKKFVSAKIPFTINGVERDCAHQVQKRHRYQRYNKTWQEEFYIETPYEEGCQEMNDKGAKTTVTEYCYCQGDLCNSSGVFRGHYGLYLFSLLITLLSRQYLYSVVV